MCVQVLCFLLVLTHFWLVFSLCVSQDKDIEGEEEEAEVTPVLSKVNKPSSSYLNWRQNTRPLFTSVLTLHSESYTLKRKSPPKNLATHTSTSFMAAVTDGGPYPLIRLPHMHRQYALESGDNGAFPGRSEVRRRRWLRLHCLSVNTPARFIYYLRATTQSCLACFSRIQDLLSQTLSFAKAWCRVAFSRVQDLKRDSRTSLY